MDTRFTRGDYKSNFSQMCLNIKRVAMFYALFEIETEHDGHEGRKGRKRTSGEIRALWRKAMLETLLLIRMEKENSDIKGMEVRCFVTGSLIFICFYFSQFFFLFSF